MPKPTARAPGRGPTEGAPAGRNRSVAAAARAAAKRSEKARGASATAEAERPKQRSAFRRPAALIAGKRSEKTDPAKKSAPRSETAASAETSATDSEARRVTPVAIRVPRRPGLLSAILAVLVVLGLAAAGTLGWNYRQGERTQQARADALAAARTAAPLILSYHYKHLGENFAAASDHITGSFSKEYKKTTTTVVAPTAKKYRGVVQASLAKPQQGGAPAASVVSASPDRVVVLMFLNQVTKSTQVKGPRVDLNRVRMTLVPTSEGWKVSAVDAL